jgi:hypothetical protein
MATPHTLGPQGHELQFATDHPGPLHGHRPADRGHDAALAAAGTDPDLGRRLWKPSEEDTGVRYDALHPAT